MSISNVTFEFIACSHRPYVATLMYSFAAQRASLAERVAAGQRAARPRRRLPLDAARQGQHARPVRRPALRNTDTAHNSRVSSDIHTPSRLRYRLLCTYYRVALSENCD